MIHSQPRYLDRNPKAEVTLCFVQYFQPLENANIQLNIIDVINNCKLF